MIYVLRFATEYYFVKAEYKLCDFGDIFCGVAQGSNIELFLKILVHDMHQTVKSNLYFYVDDSLLIYQHIEVAKIEFKVQ